MIRKIQRVAATLMILAACGVAYGAEKMAPKPMPRIEIKGLAVGMTEEEVATASRAQGEFTVGAVASKYSHSDVSLKFFEGRLDTLYFFFAPAGFSDVLAAVKSKFPAIKCSESKTQNRMGAQFLQVECELKQAGASLSIRRLAGDIETSSLSLISDRFVQELMDKNKKKSTDI